MLGNDDYVEMTELTDPFASISNDPLAAYNGNGYHSDSSSSSSSSYATSYPSSLTITPNIGGLTVHKIPAFGSSLTITKIDDKRYEKPTNTSYQRAFEKTQNSYQKAYEQSSYTHPPKPQSYQINLMPQVYESNQRSYQNSFQNGISYKHNGIVTETPKKRGRKKGSKNKFKRGIPIETWEKCGMQFNKGSLVITKVSENGGMENFVESNLAVVLNGKPNGCDENGRIKRKYTKKIKLDDDADSSEKEFQQKQAAQVSVACSSILSLAAASRLTVELHPDDYFPDVPFPKDFKVRRKKRRGPDRGIALPFSCDICRKGFKCAKGVQAHKSTKHGVEDLSSCYPCECCELVFLLKRDLSQHINEHRNTSGLLPCPEPSCDAAEADALNLARHKARRHPYLGTLGKSWFHTWGDR